jgi:hypothetical protein
VAATAAEDVGLLGEGELRVVGDLEVAGEGRAPSVGEGALGDRGALVDERVLAVGDGAEHDLDLALALGGGAEGLEKGGGALDVLFVEAGEHDDVVGEVAGADAGLVGEAGAAVDEDVVEALGVLDDLLEREHDPEAMSFAIQTREVEALEAAGVAAVEAAGGHDREGRVGAASEGLRELVGGAVAADRLVGRRGEELALGAAFGGVEEEVDEAGLVASAVSVALAGEVGDARRLEIHVEHEHPKAAGGEDPGDVDQGHAPPDAALERVKGDEGAGPLERRGGGFVGGGHGRSGGRQAGGDRLAGPRKSTQGGGEPRVTSRRRAVRGRLAGYDRALIWADNDADRVADRGVA